MVSCSWEIRDGSVSCLSDLGGQSRIERLKWDSWAKRQFMIWLTAAEPRQVKDRLSPGGKKLEAWQAHIEILSKVACCYRNQSSLIPAPQHWNTPDVGPTNKSNTKRPRSKPFFKGGGGERGMIIFTWLQRRRERGNDGGKEEEEGPRKISLQPRKNNHPTLPPTRL